MHITGADVQVWFEETRLSPVEDADITSFEAIATAVVFGALSRKYNTTVWVHTGSTPPLVKAIMAMLVAAYIYQRSYSDNADLSSYGTWLEGKALRLLTGLETGAVLLPGLTPDEDLGFDNTDFYPIENPEEFDGPYFTMRAVF